MPPRKHTGKHRREEERKDETIEGFTAGASSASSSCSSVAKQRSSPRKPQPPAPYVQPAKRQKMVQPRVNECTSMVPFRPRNAPAAATASVPAVDEKKPGHGGTIKWLDQDQRLQQLLRRPNCTHCLEGPLSLAQSVALCQQCRAPLCWPCVRRWCCQQRRLHMNPDLDFTSPAFAPARAQDVKECIGPEDGILNRVPDDVPLDTLGRCNVCTKPLSATIATLLSDGVVHMADTTPALVDLMHEINQRTFHTIVQHYLTTGGFDPSQTGLPSGIRPSAVLHCRTIPVSACVPFVTQRPPLDEYMVGTIDTSWPRTSEWSSSESQRQRYSSRVKRLLITSRYPCPFVPFCRDVFARPEEAFRHAMTCCLGTYECPLCFQTMTQHHKPRQVEHEDVHIWQDCMHTLLRQHIDDGTCTATFRCRGECTTDQPFLAEDDMHGHYTQTVDRQARYVKHRIQHARRHLCHEKVSDYVERVSTWIDQLPHCLSDYISRSSIKLPNTGWPHSRLPHISQPTFAQLADWVCHVDSIVAMLVRLGEVASPILHFPDPPQLTEEDESKRIQLPVFVQTGEDRTTHATEAQHEAHIQDQQQQDMEDVAEEQSQIVENKDDSATVAAAAQQDEKVEQNEEEQNLPMVDDTAAAMPPGSRLVAMVRGRMYYDNDGSDAGRRDTRHSRRLQRE